MSITIKNRINHKKTLPLYIAMITFIYLVVCFLTNLCFNDHYYDVVGIIKQGTWCYILLLLGYFYYISSINKIVTLILKIKFINLKIQKAIEIISEYINNHLTDFKGYKKVAKKVNKILSSKGIINTFQPIFEEDMSVLMIIDLLNKMADDKISSAYDSHKELFKIDNGFKLMNKLSKNENSQVYLSTAKDYMTLLQGTIINNQNEIASLSEKLQLDVLCKKYIKMLMLFLKQESYESSKLSKDDNLDNLCEKYAVLQKIQMEKTLVRTCIVWFFILLCFALFCVCKEYYSGAQIMAALKTALRILTHYILWLIRMIRMKLGI